MGVLVVSFVARTKLLFRILLIGLLLSLSQTLYAQITVAVASNFSVPAQAIQSAFLEQTDIEVNLAYGSSGKHYAQIILGAPFDVFLSADSHSPELLIKENKAIAVKAYAQGQLALSGFIENKAVDENTLKRFNFKYLSIANPKLAPYGRAAKEALLHLGLWPLDSEKLVTGENVGQAWRFVQSKAADFGLVAMSQVKAARMSAKQFWLVPRQYYSPIIQKAALISDNEDALTFWRFLNSKKAEQIILNSGYLLVAPNKD